MLRANQEGCVINGCNDTNIRISREVKGNSYSGKTLNINNYNRLSPPTIGRGNKSRQIVKSRGIDLKKISTDQAKILLSLVGEFSQQSYMLFDASKKLVHYTNKFRTFDASSQMDLQDLYTVCAYTSSFLREEYAEAKLICAGEKSYRYGTCQSTSLWYIEGEEYFRFTFSPFLMDGYQGCLLIVGAIKDVRRSKGFQ